MPVALNGVRGFALLALHCPSEGIASGCLAARGRLKTGHAHLNAYDPSQNEPLRPSRFVHAAHASFFADSWCFPASCPGCAPGSHAPSPDHHVVRIGNEPEPPAPPSLPEPEIIRRFSQKEDEYLAMRTHFTYKKTIRIEEFGPDGRPSGEYVLVTQPARAADGKFYEQVVQRPESTLQHFYLR